MIAEKEHRIDTLIRKAQEGDKISQIKLAKCFYYGRLVKPSLSLARYWAFMAAESDNTESTDLYKIVNAPHFTGNEKYSAIGKDWNLSLRSGTYVSNKFKGKFDVYTQNHNLYRTYLVFRFIAIYIVLGAYRVYEQTENSYQIIAAEKMHFKEYWKWLAVDLVIIILIACLYII